MASQAQEVQRKATQRKPLPHGASPAPRQPLRWCPGAGGNRRHVLSESASATCSAHASLLAKERLTLLPDNRVRLKLKRPFRDGTYALEMDVLSLLARLAAIPSSAHQTRLYRFLWRRDSPAPTSRICASGPLCLG